MKTQKPDLNSVVAKENELIGQMAKFELSELRLIAYCLAHYDSRKPDNRSFRARVEDLTSLFPMEAKSAYGVIRQTMLRLGKKPLEIREGRKCFYWNWFSGFMYDEGTGEFEFKITPEIQPYLLKLEGNFTRYRLGDVYQFRAASTWKLYELLKKWEAARAWKVELDELRLLLGVAGKYVRWDSFKRQIDRATEEINNTSDLRVSYDKLKRGRSVIGLAFTISPKKAGDENVIDLKSEKNTLASLLIEAGVHQKPAKEYAEQAERAGKTEHIINKLPAILKRMKGQPQAYILGAIKAEMKQQSLFGDDYDHRNNLWKRAFDCWQKRGEKCERKTNTAEVCAVCCQQFNTQS